MEKKHRILVFDTETTGKIPSVKSGETVYIHEYPYITQLSFIVYNTFMKQVEKKHDYYIKIPSNIIISPFINELTGITNEICETKGIDIVEAINIFYDEYMKCGCVIAHNIHFDIQMINIELQRNKEIILQKYPYCINIFNAIFEKLNGIAHYCTLRHGINICKIQVMSKENKPYNKWPKLCELYKHLFNEDLQGFHNSLFDVSACLRCYLKMRLNICMTDEDFNRIHQ